MRINYFVHSTTTHNEKGIRSGWSAVTLSETGKRQALELREVCNNIDVGHIYSSDLPRAVETTSICFPDSVFTATADLREMNYGDLNGNNHTNFNPDPLFYIDNRHPNGENCHDIQNRIELFLQECETLHDTITLVAHKYTQLALEVICNNISWSQAIENDWRVIGSWQAGWIYNYNKHNESRNHS